MNDDNRYRVDPELLDERDVDIDLESEVEADDDGGAFHDPVLRRALLHAPDHAVLPMEETRESILSFAHEAVAPSLAAAPVWAQRSFVQRLMGMRGGAGFSAHIPWNGLVVIALVGTAVVVQDRDLLGGFRSKPARNEAVEPSAPVASVMPASETAAVPAPVAPPAAAAVSSASLPAQPVATMAPVEAAPSAPAAPAIATPSVESPADAAARIALEQKLQRFEAAEAKARLAQRSDAGGLPSSLSVSVLPRTAVPVEVPMASRAGRADAAPARAEDPPSPTFSALSQWTRLTITSTGGGTRRVARADARELGPLVGSVALAGVGPQPLSGRVEWRIAFERNGEQLGLLEVAGSQVRWKENGIPAGTGAPSASGLASLRQALKEAEAEPAKVAEPAPANETAAPAAPASVEPAQ